MTLLATPALELEDEADAPSEYLPLLDERAAVRSRLRHAAKGHGPPSMRVAGRLLVEAEAAAVEALRLMHEKGEVGQRLYAEASRWLAMAGCDGQLPMFGGEA